MQVLVTGATGFISQNIVRSLIEKQYNVIGTVRSTSKGEKLKSNLDSENFTYAIVPDMIAKGSFDEVLKSNPDIEVVLHTASPVVYETSDPERDLLIPAIEGTKNIFESIHKFGENVKRVVITSSDAAIYSAKDERNSELLFDETCWNNISYDEAKLDGVEGYYGAKSMAEKYAWKFMEEKSPKFKLTTVNPVWVFGPQAFDNEMKEQLNLSNEIINGLTKLGPEDKFEIDLGGAVDVRDVAKAHLLAFEESNTIGKRLYLTSGHFSTQMILDIINKNFPELKGKIPEGKPGSGSEDIKTLAKVSNEKTREILNFEFTPLEKTVVDVVKQILNRK